MHHSKKSLTSSAPPKKGSVGSTTKVVGDCGNVEVGTPSIATRSKKKKAEEEANLASTKKPKKNKKPSKNK